jgi:4-amino-4-deoxy-L-arabinose transferase-like glycosyltransferase
MNPPPHTDENGKNENGIRSITGPTKATGASPKKTNFTPSILLLLAACNCAFQFTWFWPRVHRNINFDAVSYVGIAHHILDGHLRESLHGYWSPLISWLTAIVGTFCHDLTLAGHITTILTFFLCLPLLYIFTFRLWHSRSVAALAVLWFTLAHDTTAFSVFFIGADFIFTACVLAYFIFLLRCLRNPSSRHWLLLGLAHAIAFLAKAFAMPWLALSTLIAAILSSRNNLRKTILHAALAMIFPIVVWTGWASALHAKYGVFTAGYQSKWNLLDPSIRNKDQHAGLAVMFDTSHTYDEYTVADSMFPSSPAWKQRVNVKSAIPMSLAKMRHNLPEAGKQILVLLTPGGILAIVLALLAARRDAASPESQLIFIAVLDAASLMIGYSMLVFDRRYVLPLVPILIAISIVFILPYARIPRFAAPSQSARAVAGILVLCGVVFFQIYRASPFRTMRRDYQTSVYDAATTLRSLPSCARLAVIGEGPFPEHGVGWEEGIYASYFSSCRIVAFADRIPPDSKMDALQSDLSAVHPDGILILRGRNNEGYQNLMKKIIGANQKTLSKPITDPAIGEVGRILWNSDPSPAQN